MIETRYGESGRRTIVQATDKNQIKTEVNEFKRWCKQKIGQDRRQHNQISFKFNTIIENKHYLH